MKRFLATSLLFGVAAVLGCGGNNSGPPGTRGNTGGVSRLNAAGSSFIDPMMQKWASAYKKEHGLEINYQSVGSGAGIEKTTSKDVDFGCSDAPLRDEQMTKARGVGGEVVHIPLVMGGVVPAYNLPGVEQPIKFTGSVLAEIYLGVITKWNDPKLKELNKDLQLPDVKIAPVHRSDGSGTTFIWCDYLAKVYPDWKGKVGVATNVNWPTGSIGAKGTEGVAGQVSRTEGAIGYVELSHALKGKIKYGSVQNKDGEFVLASLESVTAAATAAAKDLPEDLRFSLTNAAGKEAYPICGTTWAILYVDQPAGKGKAIVDFLRWATHEGQESTKELQYARLPAALIERVDAKLSSVKEK